MRVSPRDPMISDARELADDQPPGVRLDSERSAALGTFSTTAICEMPLFRGRRARRAVERHDQRVADLLDLQLVRVRGRLGFGLVEAARRDVHLGDDVEPVFPRDRQVARCARC